MVSVPSSSQARGRGESPTRKQRARDSPLEFQECRQTPRRPPRQSRQRPHPTNRFALAPGSRWPPAHPDALRSGRSPQCWLATRRNHQSSPAPQAHGSADRTAKHKSLGARMGRPDETPSPSSTIWETPMASSAESRMAAMTPRSLLPADESKLVPARPERRAPGPVKPGGPLPSSRAGGRIPAKTSPFVAGHVPGRVRCNG